MQENDQTKVLSALQLVLRPIIKILIRYGIGYNEFAETVKTAFVDVGSADFGIRGRPTNISRVAVMTGLTRKEVRRLRTKIESGRNPIKVKTTPLTEILHRWHSEDQFLDKQGRPATLEFAGDGNTFSTLVRMFGGDVPPGAMRTELKRVGSVVEDGEGRLSVKRRSFFASDQTEHLRTSLVHSVYPLLANICNNTSTENSENHMPQYATYSIEIAESDIPRLRRMCSDRLSDLAASFDDLFIAFEQSSEKSAEHRKSKVRPVVVGLYFFDERDSKAEYEW